VQDALADVGWDGTALGELMGRLERRYKEPFPEPTDESLVGGLSNAIAGRICNHFDLRGGGYTVDGACSSSLLAVLSACTALSDGDLDFALAGGVDLSLDPFEMVGFARTGALATSAMRVYDQRPTGFFPGEGCGMVALMREPDAWARGLAPLALIRGWGMSSDGRGGLTRPDKDGQLIALRRAYERAGFGPETVALFEGHGTGTAVGDRAELAALMEVQKCRRRLPPAALGSIKANIGHTKAAAGIAGLIKATLALHRGIIPPTTGCEAPHELLRAPGTSLRIVSEPEPWPDAPPRAAVSAMGFGGINTHVVLEALEPHRSPAGGRTRRRQLDHEVFAFAADTRAELAEMLDRAVVRAKTMSFAELTDFSASLAANPLGSFRAAVVARDPEQLAARTRQAGRLAAELGDRSLGRANGVYVGQGEPVRVGLLFPGQGAPVGDRPGALEAVLGEADRYFGGATEGTTDTSVVQPAVFQASMAGLRWLERLGVKAAAAVGHSVGEITALCWADSISERDALDLVTTRGRIMAELGAPGTGMLSLAAAPAAVIDLIAGTDLVVAADNGPSRVVAGPLDDIERVAERARSAGVVAHRLRVSHAFHSPAVAAAEPAFATYLEGVPIGPPRRRIISTIDGRELTPAKNVRRMLTFQVTGPVHFREAAQRMAAECGLLVEVGPGRSLTSLAGEITDVPVVALDAGAESSEALCRAAGALFAAGAATDLTTLSNGRFHRPFDLWRDPEFLVNPCESAPEVPVLPTGAPEEEPATANQAGTRSGGNVAEVVCRLVAEALELEDKAINDADGLLTDLHLNSLRVAQLGARAAQMCGRAVPAAPLSFAESTVGDMIKVIEALPDADTDDGTAGPVPPGVANWHRVLVAERRPIDLKVDGTPPAWHVRGDGPLRELVEPLLTMEPGAQPSIVVFLPSDPDDRAIGALLDGARSAVEGGMPLAVVDLGDTASGFVGAIAMEHPEAAVRWIRVMDPGNADVVARVLKTTWTGHSEVLIDEAGRTHSIAYRPVPLAEREAAAPLSTGEVLLVTGGGRGIGLECAIHLAERWGVRLGLLGRSDPDQDRELVANLARIRAAGISVRYMRADVTDVGSVRRAIAEVVRELGPIVGLVHSSGLNRPGRFADLRAEDYAGHAGPKYWGLRTLLDALDRSALRLLITNGSVIGRFGLPGEAHYALANGRMRELVRLVTQDLPDCRVCNVDWTAWSGTGMGERLDVLDGLIRAGVVPLPTERGVELLARLAETPSGAYAVVATGRLPQLDSSGQGVPDEHRYLRRIRAHTPGIELIAEAELSVRNDPYVSDHRIDGLCVLPAVCALEAMAQVAAALTGREVTGVVRGRFDRPVVIPDDGARTIRICALVQEDGDVDVVVRSDETEFAVDHFSGTVTTGIGNPPDVPARHGDLPAHDGEALYGPLFFHGPFFRRLSHYEHLDAIGCTAVLNGDHDGTPGFGPGMPTGLQFGDPARNDATIHVLQACVPHRRLLPVGCDLFARHATEADSGAMTLSAVERSHIGADYVYDVLLTGHAGRSVLSWTGLRLREVGPLSDARPWPRLLLGPYLQRHVNSLLPDVRLDMTFGSADRVTGRGRAGLYDGNGRPLPVSGTAMSRSHLDGMTLTVQAAGRVGCDLEWVPEGTAPDELRLVNPWSAEADLLARLTKESDERVLLRLWTVQECLSKLGRTAQGPVTVQGVYEDGWVVIKAGTAIVVTAVLFVENTGRAVALAVTAEEPQ
jgi:enediyne polyketide synthase